MATRIPCLTLAACALTAAIGAAADYQLREETSATHTLRFAGAGPRSLDVRTLNGSIRVSGYAGSDVQLEVRKTIQADTPNDMRRAERESQLEISDNAAHLEAVGRNSYMSCGEPWRGDWHWQRAYRVTYDFTVRVPAGTYLRLCTINGGDVHVEDTAGDFEISNVNGGITIQNVRGSGSATSVNGRVAASFLEVPDTDSQFKTVNGDVIVTYPDALAADLRLKTFRGGLYTDFDVEPLVQQPTSGERRNGRFVYRSNGFTTVRVGGGGPVLTFDAFNGDVRVLRATR